MQQKKVSIILIFGIFGLNLIIAGRILAYAAGTDAAARKDYLTDQGINFISLSIPSTTGIRISADLYFPVDEAAAMLHPNGNERIPTIIMIPGANAKKTQHIPLHFQLSKHGFAVLAMEQRGHGESGGAATLYQDEPRDIQACIDYLEQHYPGLNTTHIGLVGMSYGGGTGLIVQAIEPRVYCSVLYHPLANLSLYMGDIPLPSILGFTFDLNPQDPLPNFWRRPQAWDEYLDSMWTAQNPIARITPENTANMLILHGDRDNTVNISSSFALIEKLNQTGAMTPDRLDVQMIVRPGLGHGANERDHESMMLTLTWLSHFYLNSSINLADLAVERTYRTFYPCELPPAGDYSDYFLWIAISVAMIGLFVGIVYFGPQFRPALAQPRAQLQVLHNSSLESSIESKRNRMAWIRGIIILFGFGIAWLVQQFLNPSVIFGLLWYPTILQIPLLLLVPCPQATPSHENPQQFRWTENWRDHLVAEWKSWLRKDRLIAQLMFFFIFLAPILLYFLLDLEIYRWIHAERTPFYSTSTLGYLYLLCAPLVVALLGMRDLPAKKAGIIFPLMGIGYLIVSGGLIPVMNIVDLGIPAVISWVIVVGLIIGVWVLFTGVLGNRWVRPRLILLLMVGLLIITRVINEIRIV
jgi:alpha-beta hydrolase superfamily lysophospholipase